MHGAPPPPPNTPPGRFTYPSFPPPHPPLLPCPLPPSAPQRIMAAKVIKRFIMHSKKTAFIVEHDFIMAAYLADRCECAQLALSWQR